MVDVSKRVVDYIESKISGFVKTRNKVGQILFSCPNTSNHRLKLNTPSATLINDGLLKIYCHQCNWRGSPMDVVRLLEKDKAQETDKALLTYLLDQSEDCPYPEFNKYSDNNWALVNNYKDSKAGVGDWTQSGERSKSQWMSYLQQGYGLAVLTGQNNNLTIIDFDNKDIESEDRNRVQIALEASGTLWQRSKSGGKHFFFKYEPSLKSGDNISGTGIDIQNDGRKVMVSPTKIDGLPYYFEDLSLPVKKMEDSLLGYLTQLRSSEVTCSMSSETAAVVKNIVNTTVVPHDIRQDIKTSEGIDIKGEGAGRNSLMTRLGGVLINKYDLDVTADILSLVNQSFFNPPLAKKELLSTLNSLARYKDRDVVQTEQQVYDYCRQQTRDISARDIVDSLKLPRSVVDKLLSKFRKEGVVTRTGRGIFSMREAVEWTTEFPELLREFECKVKFVSDVAVVRHGDMILLGGQTNVGKTTTAMNVLKYAIDQGMAPYYVYLEANSRFNLTSDKLGISQKYYMYSCVDPLNIELQPESLTIIDWLHIGMKEHTDSILAKLASEQVKKGGVLVVFVQLKEDNSWFAPNLIKNFPTYAARYIQNTDNRLEGYWKFDKIKESLGNYVTYQLPCRYDPETYLLEKAELVY